MKLKRFLCLTLATTITFTAVLSSSVSIFAYDFEIPQTEGSQSFASLIFEDMLLKSEESSIENPDDYGVSPMWSSDNHRNIIDYNKGMLSQYHLEILKGTSTWADKYFPSTKNGAVANIPALHGSGNYVINLEFLWYFAVFLGRQSDPTSYDDMNNKIKAARSSAIEKLKDTTAYKNKDKNQLQKLIDDSGKLVKYNGATEAYDTKRTAIEMKMRILGYASHLIGDVYSHRTILPDTKDLTMSYFTSNLATDVAKGIVEYRFLGWLPDKGGYLASDDYKDVVNDTCIDSPIYRPNRYNDAMLNVSALVTATYGAFDYHEFLCPWSDNVKLSNFKKYVKNSGLDTSELTASEWAKYST